MNNWIDASVEVPGKEYDCQEIILQCSGVMGSIRMKHAVMCNDCGYDMKHKRFYIGDDFIPETVTVEYWMPLPEPFVKGEQHGRERTIC